MAKGPLYGAVPIRHETVIAGDTFPPYRAVVRGAINTATQGKTAEFPAAATDAFFGAGNNLLEVPEGGDLHIIMEGQAIGTAGAAITRGQYLIMEAATGKLLPATMADNEQIVGIAEEAAAAEDDYFAYTIRCFTLVVA